MVDNYFQGLVTYVDTSLKLENSSIGKVVGDRILRVIMQRLLDLDVSGLKLVTSIEYSH